MDCSRLGLPITSMNSASSSLQTATVVSPERAHDPKVAGSNPAPATNFIWTRRSPVSGDLLLSLAALSIPARSPFSVIFR